MKNRFFTAAIGGFHARIYLKGKVLLCENTEMRFHVPLSAAKNYFLGLATSGTVLFAGLYYFNSEKTAPKSPDLTTVQYISAEKIPLASFDPNALDAAGWQELGFSERQVATILKYKNVVGGNFSSKAQLRKCYAISPEKFAELAPYILLPEDTPANARQYAHPNYYQSSHAAYNKKDLRIPGKFNPDHFSAGDFVKMGFTENQANAILKYKNYLGGSFISKEKFKQCFIISDENYRKLEPFLLLPDAAPDNPQPSVKNAAQEKAPVFYQNFDPNLTDLQGWQKLGFTAKQAQVIINYRDRNLGGSFRTLEEIQKCFVISPAKFAELKPFIILSAATMKSGSSPKTAEQRENASAGNAAEVKTNFATVDLNQISYKQLLEYGFDGKSAAMMLNYRKKLGGFVDKQQIIDTYDIDKNLAQKLVAEAKLDVSGVQKYTLVDAPEEWLKNHPYFKYSADKIIFYRITYPSDKKIWNYLKLKPEYEARMRLYLH